MAFNPTPKNPGDLIKATDWNDALDEVVRLNKDKLDVAGGTITGSLILNGTLGIGGSAAAPNRALTVRGAGGTYLNLIGDGGAHEVLLGADGAGGIISTMSNHDLQLRAGGNSIKMVVKADGKVGIGLPPAPTAPVQPIGFLLDVNDRVRLRQGLSPSAGLWLYQTTPNNDRAFVGMMDDNTVGFWGNTGIGWGLKMNTTNGDLVLEGDLSVRKTADGYATFTNRTFSNENQFVGNNLKLSMGTASGLIVIGNPGLTYEFAIGNAFQPAIIGPGGGISGPSFTKQFSVNHAGNVFIAGSLTAGGGKGGYVIDNFINAVGDALEQGDVIILGSSDASKYYGVGDSIPVPEVDLTAKAYDTRVCGIVESVVTADSLPPFHPQLPTEEEISAIEGEKNARRRKKAQDTLAARMENPLQAFAASVSDAGDSTTVQDGQLGKMVTLGAYAFCKVDADIAPIAVGDLLTTSPTKGHAQKVLEPEKAVGAIIGKALGSLKKGKGKIPVLVLLN